jgi:hypothetical protein
MPSEAGKWAAFLPIIAIAPPFPPLAGGGSLFPLKFGIGVQLPHVFSTPQSLSIRDSIHWGITLRRSQPNHEELSTYLDGGGMAALTWNWRTICASRAHGLEGSAPVGTRGDAVMFRSHYSKYHR